MLRQAAEIFDIVCGEGTPFVTATVALVESGGSFTVASAGHPAPIVGVGGRAMLWSVTPSPPLGVVKRAEIGTTSFELALGDWFAFYTDGIFE